MSRRRQVGTWAELRRIWITPVLALSAAAAVFLLVPFGVDWLRSPPPAGGDPGLGPVGLLFNYDLETLKEASGNLSATVTGVVGIILMVVAVVVQLAATRYTPRVTDLFLKERTNFVVLGFLVVTCILALWVSMSIGHGFLPKTAVVSALLAVTASLLLMVPYFVWLFDFLDPEKIIARIQEQALVSASNPGRDLERSQESVLEAVEVLADVAVAAVGAQDKLISARAVDALRVLMVRYTETKGRLPDAWHRPCALVRENPDFVAMHPDALDDLIRDRLWLEWKVLRQYQAIYSEALEGNPDMNYLIAIDTRYLGEAALAQGLEPSIRLVIKFFNTYMRATLNKKQVRTAYNVMNQYRQLVEAVVRAERDGLTREIAGYLRYYGSIANGMGLGFVTETIAYDVASLCELAHRQKSAAHDALLAALLELDREAEDEAQEAALRGVRKAQLRLATYYLLEGDEEHARQIHRDMAQERPERLVSIKNELLRIKSKDFWEVIDRGANFDFMSEERKEQLATFFGWFAWTGRELRPDTGPVVPVPAKTRRFTRDEELADEVAAKE